MMRILYADAGLRGPEGHLASSGIAIPPAFRRLGHQVAVLGHCDMAPELQKATGAVPFFRAFTWGRWSDDPLAGWLVDYSAAFDQTVADLHLAWAEFGPFDLIYVNTARAAQLAAAALWLKESFPDREGGPAVVVQLGPDTGLKRSGTAQVPTFELRDPKTIMHRYATHWVGKEWVERLVLVAVNQAVADEYSFLVDMPVKAMTTPEGLPTTRQRQASAALTIGVLGHQRIDKGYELLPDLIPRVLSQHKHVRFIVQHSDPMGGAQEDQPRMERITAKLSELSTREPRLEMILGPSVGVDWFELIDRCDIVALPYDPPRYASSYSAIFGEALASGAATVAPAGTTISQEMENAGGVGTTFTEWAAPSIAVAIGAAVDRFDDLRKRAYQAGLSWRKRHGPDAYAAAVVEAAGLGVGPTTPAAARPGRSTKSRSLPARFLRFSRLHNGASIKLAYNGAGDTRKPERLSWLVGKTAISLGRGQFSSILGTTIETSTTPWCYSLTADADTGLLRNMPSGSQLAIEMMIEVDTGAVGVAWLGKDYKITSIERAVRAGPGTQRVFALVPCEQAHYLMLRNVALNGDKTVFTLRQFKVTATVR